MRRKLFSLLIVIALVVITSSCNHKTPEACYTISSVTDTVNQPVTFSSACTEGGSFYYWDLGDGTIVKTPTVTHAYATEGVYAITFWASNSVGSSQGTAVNVTVTNWKSCVSGTSANLNSVYFPSADTGYIVGDSGTILKTTNAGVKWTALKSISTTNLHSVYFVSNEIGYAVGDQGTVLETVNGGSTWLLSNKTGTTANLTSVYFFNSTTGYITGAAGTLLSTTNGGSSWSVSTLVTSTLSSVYFVSSTLGYTVGAGGVILQTTNGGSTWSAVTSGTTNDLESIGFDGSSSGYIVGSNGTILKTSDGGNTWQTVVNGTTTNITSVCYKSSIAYAVGYGGLIINNTTNAWSGMLSGVSYYLSSVYFTSSNTGYVVGNAGTILKIK